LSQAEPAAKRAAKTSCRSDFFPISTCVSIVRQAEAPAGETPSTVP
jgi:hypothetical protein